MANPFGWKQTLLVGAIAANFSLPVAFASTVDHARPIQPQSTHHSMAAAASTNTASQLADHTLTLPNGRVLTSKGDLPAVKWKNLLIQLEILGAVGGKYETIMDNHSQILSHSFIQTPAGKAWFALSVQTPPAAAADPNQKTYKYWIAVLRPYPGRSDMNLAYTIKATITSGTKQAARTELLNLVKHWHVPAPARK